MRKPRDFDAELKALNEKAKQLRERRVHQLGELVIATAADALPIEQLAGALLAAAEAKETAAKEGWRKRGAAFFQGEKRMAIALAATAAARRRVTAARHRLQARITRDDKRGWVVKRRERTRQLIELGGLVAKAGLIDLTDDDRAVIFGLMIEAAASLRGPDRERSLGLWRRRGKRAFALAAHEAEGA